jgi:hypothetical protein
MAEQKTCKQCQKEFTVEDEDLEFYKKISPTFDGKLFEIPSPTLCPDCRRIRRIVWRNNLHLYNRKCDLCSKQIVSMYSEDKPYEVYCQECWWSDKWDPLKYGRDFNPSHSFFDQFNDLLVNVPRIALMNKDPENSEYCNFAGNNKDCYLAVAGSWNNENCFYGYRLSHCKDCIDCKFTEKCELCYEVITGFNLYKCVYCQSCYDSTECYFSYDLKGCDHCVFSAGLRNKSYYVYNSPCSKEEFQKIVADISSRQKLSMMREGYDDMLKRAVRPYAELVNCENCTGDQLFNCMNARESYDAFKIENAKYFMIGEDAKDVMDCSAFGIGESQLSYEAMSAGVGSYNCHFTNANWTNRDTFYCETISNSNNCFGCVSLNHKEYCILNKQYSKEEYEKKVGEIIECMRKSGEWGEFFPIRISPYGYNETLASDFSPLSQSEAEKIGAKWQPEQQMPSFSGESYQPFDDVNDYAVNEEGLRKVISSVIKCEKTGKPFKVMPQEMSFYLNNKIALPRYHYTVRFDERLKYQNPRKLYHRQCMCEEQGHGHEGRCKNEFETTYAPDRPEKVYCEECYQKNII